MIETVMKSEEELGKVYKDRNVGFWAIMGILGATFGIFFGSFFFVLPNYGTSAVNGVPTPALVALMVLVTIVFSVISFRAALKEARANDELARYEAQLAKARRDFFSQRGFELPRGELENFQFPQALPESSSTFGIGSVLQGNKTMQTLLKFEGGKFTLFATDGMELQPVSA